MCHHCCAPLIAWIVKRSLVAAFTLPLLFSYIATNSYAQTETPARDIKNTSAPLTEVNWNRISEDLETGDGYLLGTTLLSTDLKLVRTALRNYSVRVLQVGNPSDLPLANVRSLAKADGAVVAINASFFDKERQPLGLIIRSGKQYQGVHRGGSTLTGIFGLYRGRPTIINRTKFLSTEFSSKGMSEAIQAGPRLISGSTIVPDLRAATSPARRAAVCIDNKNRLVLACTVSGLVGLSMEQLVQILLDPKIGCVEALNLDGGGSAQLFVDSSKTALKSDIFIEGRDAIPVALGLYARG